MSLQDRLKNLMGDNLQKEKDAGIAFMEKNKTEAGVKELPEGIQYSVLQEGTGNSPSIHDKIKAHYSGSLLSGKEFDSSFKRGQPFTANLTQLIKGWQIAIPLMKEGSRWRLWIPSHLAYGDRGAGHDIPGGATLIFDVELLEILK